jgi:hypothetical protein
LAYNFNNGIPVMSPGAREDVPATPEPTAPTAPKAPNMSPGPTPATSDVPQSAAFVRFRSCRWMQPAENGNSEFCTHREVKPYAGTTGFDADAWCPDCQYYKLRRAPKKRQPSDDYTY